MFFAKSPLFGSFDSPNRQKNHFFEICVESCETAKPRDLQEECFAPKKSKTPICVESGPKGPLGDIFKGVLSHHGDNKINSNFNLDNITYLMTPSSRNRFSHYSLLIGLHRFETNECLTVSRMERKFVPG